MNRQSPSFYAKCLGNLLLHILWLFSHLTPRNKQKWVVGNAKGFNNNTKYFFIYAKDVLHRPVYWISKNKKCREDVRRLGYQAYHPWSLKGLFHLLTAHVYVYDLRISALNYWTSGRAKKVNLWHGVGIKNVEFKRQAAMGMKAMPIWLEYLRHPIAYVKPDLFLSTSPMMTKHFAECFRIPESRCIESEYPRCRILKDTKEELIRFIDKYEPAETKQLIQRIATANRTYIYMPTWRNTGEDFIREAGFDLSQLEKVLHEKNELFLFKLHPFTSIQMDTTQYRHILFLSNKMDIYPVLPFTDVLITDYSSIYYDYLLIPGKEILLFPFDYDEYLHTERDLAFDFDTYTPGERVRTFNELMEAILSGRHFTNDRKQWITDMFWKSDKSEDLYQVIGARL